MVVHGTEGAEDGYASYRPVGTSEWFRSRDRTVVVDDFVAHNERAYLGLARHLATLDLVDTIRLPGLRWTTRCRCCSPTRALSG